MSTFANLIDLPVLSGIFLPLNCIATQEHEQRVTLEIEGWLNDRRIKLKELHKFWSEKLRSDITLKDQELAEVHTANSFWTNFAYEELAIYHFLSAAFTIVQKV